jgi:hypothetical protein
MNRLVQNRAIIAESGQLSAKRFNAEAQREKEIRREKIKGVNAETRRERERGEKHRC